MGPRNVCGYGWGKAGGCVTDLGYGSDRGMVVGTTLPSESAVFIVNQSLVLRWKGTTSSLKGLVEKGWWLERRYSRALGRHSLPNVTAQGCAAPICRLQGELARIDLPSTNQTQPSNWINSGQRGGASPKLPRPGMHKGCMAPVARVAPNQCHTYARPACPPIHRKGLYSA